MDTGWEGEGGTNWEINSLSVALFVNIFSHSVGCLFVLFMVSFAVQKLLSLIRFHLFIYLCFYFRYSRSQIQNDIAAIYVRVFCLCFPLRVSEYQVLHLGL